MLNLPASLDLTEVFNHFAFKPTVFEHSTRTCLHFYVFDIKNYGIVFRIDAFLILELAKRRVTWTAWPLAGLSLPKIIQDGCISCHVHCTCFPAGSCRSQQCPSTTIVSPNQTWDLGGGRDGGLPWRMEHVEGHCLKTGSWHSVTRANPITSSESAGGEGKYKTV